MPLTHSQKKYLKKNIKHLSLKKIACNLNLSEKEILNFLKSHWRKEKYQKFLKKQQQNQKKSLQSSFIVNFSFKKWFIQNWKIIVFLILLVFAVYFNSLGNDFVSDDIAAIKENQNINNTSYFLRAPYFNIGLRSFTVFLTHKIFGLNHSFYHLVNILSHLGSVIIVYLFICFFFKSPIPLLTAGIFAVHPILTESVTWISGGHYSQSTFFILLSFLIYILAKHKKSLKFYLFSLFIFYIALLFSEKVVIFPIILLLYEFSFDKLKSDWKKLFPFFGLAGLWTLYLISSIGDRVTALQTTYYQEQGIDNPLIQIPIAVSSYLKLIFWPKNLTLYHSEMTFNQVGYFTILGIFVIFLVTLFYFFKKEKRIFFWLSFFFISLLTTLTPLRIGWIVAERYVYLGSLGIIVLMAWLIQKVGQITKNKKITWVIFGIILLALSTRTIIRNTDWKNQDTLWLATAKTSPSSSQNHNNLGDLYFRQGKYEKAIKEFRKAIDLKPNYGDAFHNMANTYHQMDNDNLALKNYQKAVSFNANLWQSHQNSAVIYFNQQKFEFAKQELEKAIAINSQNDNLYINLGITYLKLNEKEKAREAFQQTVKINPQNKKAYQLLLSL